MDIDSSALDGRQLPQPGRLISKLRDLTILDLPAADTPKCLSTRTAIVFSDDKQADPRIYDVLLAFHYRSFKHRVNLVGIAKVLHQGTPALRWWYGSPLDALAAHRALSEATHAALRPSHDKWNVEPPIIVTMQPDGTVDRERLPENDLLRLAVPLRYRLGLVQS